MDTNLNKTMYEMSNRELFCVLTGDRGIMAQKYLQEVVRDYLKKYREEADLQTMVRTMVEEEGTSEA